MGPIGSKVIEVKGQIYVVFSVCSSQVFGPIFTKLGGKVEGGPRSSRSKVPLCLSYLRLCVCVCVCVCVYVCVSYLSSSPQSS